MRLLLSIVLTAFSASAVLAQQSIELGTQLPAADVKMKDISGKSVAINDVKGKNGLLVMFSCNTCPYVVKNQARTLAISKFAEEKGFGVILINSNEAKRDADDSFEEMKQYAKKQGYKWHYVVDEDSKVADAFGATRTPEVFLFDNGGKLVYKGAIDDNPSDADNVKREHLKHAVEEILAKKEVSVKQTKSIGCSIKRKS